MERDNANRFMLDALKTMMEQGGSDLFITVGFPPAIKKHGKMTPIADKALTAAQTQELARSIMTEKQAREFEQTRECNFAIHPQGIGRFRVNAFVQQGRAGMVLRTITTDIPDFDKLGLPPVLKEVVLSKTGLVLMV
ncbi:MAG: type IV pili twitching motility protein PilT, partial [Magnetococcales bacterium]|nr:type IV pili twitching motility protein PilT [Magnetococcales bacterium]